MFTEYSFNIYHILLFSISQFSQFFLHMCLSVNQVKQLEGKKKKKERKVDK